MKTVSFNDPAFNELCAGPLPAGLSAATNAEYRAAFPAPVVIPPPDGGIPGTIPGFDHVQHYLWDWNNAGGGGMSFYTGPDQQGRVNPQGPIGLNGIVVIECVPFATPGVGDISIAPYPGGSQARTVSISTVPGDFSMPLALPWIVNGVNRGVCRRKGYDQGIQFTVGPNLPEVYANLIAGERIYINICNRDAYGVNHDGNFHVQASRPR